MTNICYNIIHAFDDPIRNTIVQNNHNLLQNNLFNLNVSSIKYTDLDIFLQNNLDFQISTNPIFKFNDNLTITQEEWEGYLGHWASSYVALKNFVNSNFEYLILLEDDVILTSIFVPILQQALLELPEDWEIFIVNSHKGNLTQYRSEIHDINKKLICKRYTLFGASGLCFNKKSAQKILNEIKKGINVPADWKYYYPEFGLSINCYEINPYAPTNSILADWLDSKIMTRQNK